MPKVAYPSIKPTTTFKTNITPASLLPSPPVIVSVYITEIVSANHRDIKTNLIFILSGNTRAYIINDLVTEYAEVKALIDTMGSPISRANYITRSVNKGIPTKPKEPHVIFDVDRIKNIFNKYVLPKVIKDQVRDRWYEKAILTSTLPKFEYTLPAPNLPIPPKPKTVTPSYLVDRPSTLNLPSPVRNRLITISSNGSPKLIDLPNIINRGGKDGYKSGYEVDEDNNVIQISTSPKNWRKSKNRLEQVVRKTCKRARATVNLYKPKIPLPE